MAKRKTGRPVRFSSAIAAGICARLAAGETLRAICRDRSLPAEAVVRGWAIDRPRFAAAYERAREIGYATLADQLLEIADDSSTDTCVDDKGKARPVTEAIQRSRLRVDTRKWLLAEALPRIRGERPEKEEGKESNPFTALVLRSCERKSEPDK
jgi:hypothetical protein